MRNQNTPKPVLKWAGGKTGLIPQLLKHFPKRFNRYFEPFFGGGAVFFNLGMFSSSVINDVNPELTNLYEVIRDNPKDLMKHLDSLRAQYSEKFYYQIRSEKPKSQIKRAARTLFLNKTCFNGLYRQNSRGEFNVPFGKRETAPKLYDRDNVLKLSKNLKTTQIFNLDFEKVIELAGEGDFIYCDPPYEPISKTASFNSYFSHGFTKRDQQRLFEACSQAVQRGAKVAVSNSSAPFIRKLFQEWDLVRIISRRSINSRGDRRAGVEELLAKSYS